MSEEKKEEEYKGIVVELKMEKMIDRKGEVIKDNDGEPFFKRHDALALMQILNAINTRQYDFKALKVFGNLKEKVDEAWMKDKDKLELTLDQASFLKVYIEEFNKKSNPQFQGTPFHIRTMITIAKQLDN